MDGVGGRARELKELIQRHRPDVIIVSEANALTMRGLQDMWPGAKIEYVPSWKKSLVAMLRAGTALLIRSDLLDSVAYIHNEGCSETNSVIQSIYIELEHGTPVTGTYVLPRTPGPYLDRHLERMKGMNNGKDFLLGELNARQKSWDTVTNVPGASNDMLHKGIEAKGGGTTEANLSP